MESSRKLQDGTQRWVREYGPLAAFNFSTLVDTSTSTQKLFLKGMPSVSLIGRNAGVNYGRSVGPDSTMLDGNNIDFNIWQLQTLKELKWLDTRFLVSVIGVNIFFERVFGHWVTESSYAEHVGLAFRASTQG